MPEVHQHLLVEEAVVLAVAVAAEQDLHPDWKQWPARQPEQLVVLQGPGQQLVSFAFMNC